MIEEQAKATEELIAALTKKHTQQMEALIKSTTKAMKEMMSLIKNKKKEPGKQKSDEEKKKNERNEDRNTMTHLSVRIAARNIPQKKRMNVGNSKRTKNPVLPTENRRRAPEGARGP
jgi:hypothetical protein